MYLLKSNKKKTLSAIFDCRINFFVIFLHETETCTECQVAEKEIANQEILKSADQMWRIFGLIAMYECSVDCEHI